MAAKGQKRSPNEGRKKGTPNKRTEEAQALAERLGVDPLAILLHFAAGNWEQLGLEGKTKTIYTAEGEAVEVDRIDEGLRQKSAKDALPYIRPQLKAIEVSAGEGASLNTFTDLVSALIVKNGEDKKQ